MKYFVLCVCLSFLMVSVCRASFVNIQSTFDAGDEGWTLEGNGYRYWVSSGGNPNGYVEHQDIGGNLGDGWLVAPSTFHGDWSTLGSLGVLSWDAKIIGGSGSGVIQPGQATISGPGGEATHTSSQFMSYDWTNFSAPIVESSWSVTEGSWNTLISDVSKLTIRIEGIWNHGSLANGGIDNVMLVPEPTTLLLFSVGVMIVRRKCQTCRK